MAEHGGRGTKYVHEGCRCELCTAANTARIERRRAQRRPRDYEGEHGKASVYSNWNCRCEACTEAHKAACQRQYEARKLRKAEAS